MLAIHWKRSWKEAKSRTSWSKATPRRPQAARLEVALLSGQDQVVSNQGDPKASSRRSPQARPKQLAQAARPKPAKLSGFFSTSPKRAQGEPNKVAPSSLSSLVQKVLASLGDPKASSPSSPRARPSPRMCFSTRILLSCPCPNLLNYIFCSPFSESSTNILSQIKSRTHLFPFTDITNPILCNPQRSLPFYHSNTSSPSLFLHPPSIHLLGRR